MLMRKIFILFLPFAAYFLTGCAPQLGGSDYDTNSVGTVSSTLKGTIISARVININAKDRSNVGAGGLIGGLAGAGLGSTIGSGKGSMLSTVLGGLAGGAAGHFAEQKMTAQQGIEYQVKLDRGDTISIAQGAEPKLIQGDRVLIIQSPGGRSRVILDR